MCVSRVRYAFSGQKCILVKLLLHHNGQTFMNSREWSNKIQSNLTERISFSLHSPDSVFAQLPTALFTISALAARVAIRAVTNLREF